jgi:hypothetical protein
MTIPIIILLVALIGFGVYRYEKSYRENWTRYTSPLPVSTIKDLCERLDLSDDDRLCRLEKDVYAGDFYSIIRKRIIPKDQDRMDYDQVNEFLGPYIVDECYVMPGSEEDVSCIFDLRGDRVYFIGADFDSVGKLIRLFTPLELW